MIESKTYAIKSALQQIKKDSVSEKWQFLLLSTNEAIGKYIIFIISQAFWRTKAFFINCQSIKCAK